MILSSHDQRDLLIPLYAGVHDETQWRSFLERVKRRTGAGHAGLFMMQDETPGHRARRVVVGLDPRPGAASGGLGSLYDGPAPSFRALRPNRVYQWQELMAIDATFRQFATAAGQAPGISDARFVRVQGRDNMHRERVNRERANGWLMVSREEGAFSAADGALLSALGPHLATALRTVMLVEQLRLRLGATGHALARAGGGWLLLGRDARIIDADPGLSPLLERIGVPADAPGERLHLPHAQARQIVAQAAQDFATSAGAAPRAFTMHDEPRVDALLLSVADDEAAARAGAVMLLLCRTPPRTRADRRPLLQQLFGLSRRESELALLLADGLAVAQAAAAMGIMDETARGYLKAIFAKTDCHSQSELTRRLFSSVIDFA